MIPFACSQCGQQLRAPDELAGKKVRCPQCGGVTSLPGFASASKGAITSPDPLAPPPRQTPDPGPTAAPVLVEPFDPAEVLPAATAPPAAVEVQPLPLDSRLAAVPPRSGLGRLA